MTKGNDTGADEPHASVIRAVDPLLSPLIGHILHDSRRHPHLASLTVQSGVFFSWNHPTCTITYDPNDPAATIQLLHEYGHALLGHTGYSRDIKLLAMERAAWDRACDLGQQWNITITDDHIESALDTYRDWLHARSRCPRCGATGIQRATGVYHCLACYTQWHANAATTRHLRRRIVSPQLPDTSHQL